MIVKGNPAPNITFRGSGGVDVSLAALRPARVVLFTYGADGTPTCTNEIMDFNALHEQFVAEGCVVVGLSKDSVKKHESFSAAKGIKFMLASDLGGTLMQDLGTFGEKIFFGKLVQGVLRTTFLIDGNGVVAEVWKVDKVKGHAQAVLDAVLSTPVK
jgi:peroxiredoxin Q/BCP